MRFRAIQHRTRKVPLLRNIGRANRLAPCNLVRRGLAEVPTTEPRMHDGSAGCSMSFTLPSRLPTLWSAGSRHSGPGLADPVIEHHDGFQASLTHCLTGLAKLFAPAVTSVVTASVATTANDERIARVSAPAGSWLRSAHQTRCYSRRSPSCCLSADGPSTDNPGCNFCYVGRTWSGRSPSRRCASRRGSMTTSAIGSLGL